MDAGGYRDDPALRFAEAWDPLARIAMRHHIANLPDQLVLWRRHSAATSIRHRQQAQAACDATVQRNLYRLANANEGNTICDYEACYSGLRAFLFTPNGTPSLPAQYVIAGLELLCEVQERFYQINDFPRSLVARHRRGLNWSWGKHAVALATRAQWALSSRVRILALGIRQLGVWAWAVVLASRVNQ
jgi:hypothetical protein